MSFGVLQPRGFDKLPTRTPFTAIAVMVGDIIAELRISKTVAESAITFSFREVHWLNSQLYLVSCSYGQLAKTVPMDWLAHLPKGLACLTLPQALYHNDDDYPCRGSRDLPPCS